MMFKKPEIDVERHIEMRVRRVFPISLEGALKAKYEEALKRLKEAVELERQAWQLATEKSILESRLGIWNWLGTSLDVLAKALTEGSYQDALSVIDQIRNEVLKRYQEEQQLLERVNKGERVLSTYSSSSSYAPIKVYTSTTTSTTTTSTTQPTSTTTNILSTLEAQARKTGETYVVPASTVSPGAQGYYVITPQGGYSTKDYPTTTKLSSPSYIPAFNPFQQSGFYNPYRMTTAPQLTTTYQPLFAGTYTATTSYHPFR